MKIKIGKNPYIVIASIFACLFLSHSTYASSNISIANSGDIISFGDIKASSTGTMATATDELTITTDCDAGSNIYISAVNDPNVGTSLVNHAATSNNEITTITGTTIGSTALALTNNTWGFNTVDNGTYYGLPTYVNGNIAPIYVGTDTTVPIYYGAKVTNSLTPGKYIGQVLYTATVNNSCLNYTLKFGTNGATSSTLTDQTHGVNDLIDLSTISSTNAIAKDGYHLTGWKDQDNRSYGTTGTVDVNPTDTTPVTLTAQWEVNTYTIKYNSNTSTTPDCSDTVHPTTTTGCKMADGKIWILGNSGNAITWANMFTGATGQDNHNATVNSGICPADYSAPTIVDYDNLIIAYGGTPYSRDRNGYQETTGALYSMLGLSGARFFWSSTEYNSNYAYLLGVGSGDSNSSYSDGKGYNLYVLCYKATSSASGSTADQTSQAYNTNVTLRANGYTLEGYDFLGWSLDPSATSASYSAGTSYAVSTLANAANVQNTNGANITLYAIWKQKRTVTITSGTGISSTTGAGTYSVGQTVNISATPSSGYNFSSWTVNSGGASLASTTSSSTSFTMPDANVTITANGVESTPTCSASVHPTTSTGCKMADNKTWILGNNGGTAAWTALFTNATGADGHDATLISGKCPSGYSAAKLSDYQALLSAQGTGSQLYTALGLSGTRRFWSSTELGSSAAYVLSVGSSTSGAYTGSYGKSYTYYLLCVK